MSSATASLVLNDKADTIPEATRERIRAAADQLGYRPNLVAQNLRRRSSQTIAILSDQVLTTPYAAAMIEGAQEVVDEHEYGLLLINITPSGKSIERAVNTVLDRQVDAVAYASMYHRPVDVPKSLGSVPIVVLNGYPTGESISWVAPDERSGAEAAMGHLIDRGHTRIGWLDEHVDSVASRMRGAVWAEQLRRIGVEPDPALSVSGAGVAEGSTAEAGLNAALELLQRPNPPTALFCFNDRMASGAAIAARRLGLTIPEDLSLVGFDNQVLVAEAVDPGLTTVQLPHYEMGRWAMEQLFDLLNERAGTVGKSMPCPLVERQSVAPPRRH